MSGSPKNIQRDGMFISCEQAPVSFGTEFQIAEPVIYSGTATVNVDFASAQAQEALTLTAAHMATIGVYMQQPLGDRTPYRVHCSFSDSVGFLIVGIAPATPGVGSTIIEPIYISTWIGYIDEMVIVEPNPTYEDRALAFMAASYSNLGKSAVLTTAHISVQNLGLKPPTMQNAVS